MLVRIIMFKCTTLKLREKKEKSWKTFLKEDISNSNINYNSHLPSQKLNLNAKNNSKAFKGVGNYIALFLRGGGGVVWQV